MPKARCTTAVLAIAFGIAVGGCSSTATDTTSSTTTAAGEELEQQMCRTLEILEASGVSGPAAANALLTVDLADADNSARSAYGHFLIDASRSHCPASTAYADDVAYWLGF